ncbi:MAG TPA: DUF423 domain-containing protein [Verrucomicrobiae bacterium]|jgi:uncharacterized membrane protein YgdD (TMEM256/DUF423 family)|nr:DUF423 domain-containing protein [Verrucomicrobiae bacterium]
MDRLFILLGSLSAFFAVALGAFAAHGLKSKLPPDMFNIFEVGVRYHMYHALGLFAVAAVAGRWSGPWVTAAGWLFVFGTIVFSGSLYLLATGGPRWLGAITPIGGLAFLAGWLLLAWAVWR